MIVRYITLASSLLLALLALSVSALTVEAGARATSKAWTR
jgi:hypothetical protein